MFKVRGKHTGKVRTVYGMSGVNFLFYEDGKWFYGPIDAYEPVEEEE